MNWEQCRNFGLIQIDPINNTIKLYYGPNGWRLAGNPNFLIIENAIWQGENLLVRGTDAYGNSLVYVMNDFNNCRRIV
jgi:hypothetical protein